MNNKKYCCDYSPEYNYQYHDKRNFQIKDEIQSGITLTGVYYFADAELHCATNDDNLSLSSESCSHSEEENSDGTNTDLAMSSDHSKTSSTEQSSYNDEQESSSNESVPDSEQPFCAGTTVKRRTFDAAFLAVSNKHSFSKSARSDLINFLNTVLPDANLAPSNYMFEKKLIETMDVHFTKFELCIECNTQLTDARKCPSETCALFHKKLYDHQIEICYFIPIKDQLQRILTGMFY